VFYINLKQAIDWLEDKSLDDDFMSWDKEDQNTLIHYTFDQCTVIDQQEIIDESTAFWADINPYSDEYLKRLKLSIYDHLEDHLRALVFEAMEIIVNERNERV